MLRRPGFVGAEETTREQVKDQRVGNDPFLCERLVYEPQRRLSMTWFLVGTFGRDQEKLPGVWWTQISSRSWRYHAACLDRNTRRP
jgi:hypothetical protein